MDPQIDIKNFTVASQKDKDQKEYEAHEKDKDYKRSRPTIIRDIKKAAEESQKEQKKAVAENEEALKKEIIYKINLYKERFPFLNEKIPKVPARISLVEAEEILGMIRYEMDSQKSLEQIWKYFEYGATMMETIWGDGSRMTFLPPELRLNLNGLSKVFRSDAMKEEMDPIIKEMDIEYPSLGRRSLPMRIIEAASTVLIKVHMSNMNPALQRVINLASQPPVSESSE